MKRTWRLPVKMSFTAALHAVLERAPQALIEQGVAIYLLDLNDKTGFTLAEQIHAREGGPEPAMLRARANLTSAKRPMVAGTAAIRSIFAETDRQYKRLQSLAARGETPVIIVESGTTEITTLEAIESQSNSAPLAQQTCTSDALRPWFRPFIGEA